MSLNASLSAIGQRVAARLSGFAQPNPLALTPPSQKSSLTGPLIAFDTLRQAVWTPRDYATFAREGFAQNAIVYRCVRMIADAAASVPLLLYAGDEEIEDHPLLDLIRRPNPFQAGPDLFESFYGFLLVSGNAYLEAVALAPDAQWASEGATKSRASEGATKIREIHALRPDRTKVIPGPDGWPEAYEYTVGGRTVRIAGDVSPGVRPVLHMKLFHASNDHYGMSPLEAAATAIDLHNTAAKWNKALLDNSARPSGALVYASREGNLSAEQYERLKAELETGFQGATNAGRPLLLEGGLDWKSMSLSPKDMDFIEARHVAAREIALALGVPPMLLGIPGDNTYSNMAEAQRIFWRQTVLPLVNRTALALSSWLGPAHARLLVGNRSATKESARLLVGNRSANESQPLEFRPDLDAVEALSPERESLWARLEKSTFLTPNEKRSAAGYGPLPGGDELKRSDLADKFNPHHDALGRFTFGDGDGDDGGAETPQPVQFPGRNRGGSRRPPPPPGHNNPPGPTPVPVPVPLPGRDPATPDVPPPSGGDGGEDPPEFLKQKPGPGSLAGNVDGLTPAERNFANEMRDLGNQVEALPSSSAGRSPDFRINGKLYELKTVSGVHRTDADGLSGAISSRIMDGRGQSSEIIVDARDQAGMTTEVARRAVVRAYGADEKKGIQTITILTQRGTIHAPRRP